MIARLRIVDGCKQISYIYSILYTIYETFSTHRDATQRSQVFDEGDVVEVPNYQYLCHYIIPLNRSTGKLSRISRISIDYLSLGHLALLAYFA